MFSFIHLFILKWGYLALFLGAMIEGETVVMTISSMSYQGYFKFHYVLFLCFLGTLIADQICFYIGRFLGRKMFKKYPSLKQKSKKILELIEKYDIPFILGFRFVYGIRILSPFVIGFSNVPTIKFLTLNFLAAILWSSVICSVGYLIGSLGVTITGSSSFVLLICINTCMTLFIIGIMKLLSKYFEK